MTLTRTATTFPPPVMEARRWLEGVTFPTARPLINVSQAAPVDPPPAPLRQAMADVALNNDEAHLYGPVLGLPELRAELAAQTAVHYAGTIHAEQVCITSGCNQAFAAAIAMLCSEGDEIILPTPWYFNHKMWLDMSGVTSVPLATGADLLPDPLAAAALITPRTRAIALVTPNNPGGVEYPAELVQAFFDLARDRGIALILDETYRDFDSRQRFGGCRTSNNGWLGNAMKSLPAAPRSQPICTSWNRWAGSCWGWAAILPICSTPLQKVRAIWRRDWCAMLASWPCRAPCSVPITTQTGRGNCGSHLRIWTLKGLVRCLTGWQRCRRHNRPLPPCHARHRQSTNKFTGALTWPKVLAFQKLQSGS